ncbi:C-C motif chemokine 5-like [Podarcis muralis]
MTEQFLLKWLWFLALQNQTMALKSQGRRRAEKGKPGSMKTSGAALVFLLLVAIPCSMKISGAAVNFLLLLATPPLTGRRTPAPGCCLSNSKVPIPKSEVEDYALSRPYCLRSVEFHLKHGKFRCADPDQPWVHELMEYIDSLEDNCI